MTDDLDELERLARDAFHSPPWTVRMRPGDPDHDAEVISVQEGYDLDVAVCVMRDDAAYIAAASPDVILRLIARLRAAEGR